MKLVYVVFFVLQKLTLALIRVKETYFMGDSRYDNILPLQDLIWSVTPLSEMQCGITCTTNTSCLAFFTDGAWCHGYSNRMHDLVSTNAHLNFSYYEMKGKFGNLAVGKDASQSSVAVYNTGTYSADQAVDGRRYPVPIKPGDSCAHTVVGQSGNQWWRVDLAKMYYISQVALLHRSDAHAQQIGDIEISVAEFEVGIYKVCGTTDSNGWLGKFETFTCPEPLFGRFVMLKKLVDGVLCVCEVEVYANN